MIFPAIYTDTEGSVQTEIINDSNENGHNYMSMTIDGIEFQGRSFDDFEILNINNYSKKQLERFTLNRVPYYKQPDKFSAELCNCTLQFDIPVIIIDIKAKKEISKLLSVSLSLGKPASNGGIDYEMANFQMTIENQTYKSQGDVFEDALDILKRELGNNLKFKNCYGCLYSDFSPYGVGFFESLMCFKQQKQAYLDLNKDFSKRAFFEVIENGFIPVQETYCCEEFTIRDMGTGYRRAVKF